MLYLSPRPSINPSWKYNFDDKISHCTPLFAILRGLDVHPKTQERFDRQKDQESVDILEVIYTDEITHVAAGIRWFTYICQHSDPPIECIPKFHELVRAHFRYVPSVNIYFHNLLTALA